MPRDNQSSFIGELKIHQEAGRVVNQICQMHLALGNVRIGARNYYLDVETDFCKCSYCGGIWQKIQDYEDDTDNLRT